MYVYYPLFYYSVTITLSGTSKEKLMEKNKFYRWILKKYSYIINKSCRFTNHNK